MRAIVTGGAGFIGSHVVDALLTRGDDVLVLDDLSRGKRENVPEGAQLEVVDIREPLSPYGVSKLAAEEYVAAYSRLYDSGHVSLRYGNVYGPRQDPHGEAGVVAIFLGRLAGGERPRIFGDGRQTRDYVYAGDVARATLAAVGKRGVFNVGTGIETSVLDLYELCRKVAESELEADHAEARLGELQRSVLDVTRAERELGWRPEVGLEDGLQRTWGSLQP